MRTAANLDSVVDSIGDRLPEGVLYELVLEPGGSQRFIYMSSGIEAISGYPARRVMAKPSLLQAQLVGDDRRSFLSVLFASLRKMETFELEVQIRTRGGKTKWLQLRSQPRRLENGGYACDGIALDITTRREAALALARIHYRNKQILDAAAQLALITTDLDGRVQAVNRGAEMITGKSATEVSQEGPMCLVSGEELALRFREHGFDSGVSSPGFKWFIEALRQRLYSEWTCVTAAGKKKILGIAVTPLLEEGATSGYLFNAQDVTERHSIERRLRLSEALLRETESLARIGGWRLDFRTMTPQWSNEVAKIFEISLQEKLSFEDILEFFCAEGQTELRQCVDGAMQLGRPFQVERQVTTALGNERWVRVVGQPQWKDGGWKYMNGLFQDVSERKWAESALRRAMDALSVATQRQAAILDALPSLAALIDRQGTILAVNGAWKQFGAGNSLQDAQYGVGRNYFEVCEASSASETNGAPQTSAGIRDVLEGRIESFCTDYPCHSPAELRWFRLTVRRWQDRGDRGAVVMHTNITALKVAEEALGERRLRNKTEEDVPFVTVTE